MHTAPTVKHLVLIGGGHSHLFVLRRFLMEPIPGLAVTLITRDVVTPYSGAMPAAIAGDYSLDDMHIDLRPLARRAGIRLIQQEVSGLDLERKRVLMEARPDIPFDLLSLNIGSRPDSGMLRGAADHGLPVKPIDTFLVKLESTWQELRQRLQAGKEYNLALIGGGPASVELAFALSAKLERDTELSPRQREGLCISLFSASPQLLSGHNQRVRAAVTTALSRAAVQSRLECRIDHIEADAVVAEDGQRYAADRAIIATGASLPSWPFDCGLARSEDGFLEVTDTLQSSSHDFVFIAGDAASIQGEPRPKSGVYAVRQGPPLAENLRRFATGKRTQSFKPQRSALALLNLCNGRAIASRGEHCFQGRWVWFVKDWIDRRFVRRFSDLPHMPVTPTIAEGLLNREQSRELAEHSMRCAGCGAKLAGGLLGETLAGLEPLHHDDTQGTVNTVEDAAQIQVSNDRKLVQSVDALRDFIADPYLFGRIATLHCLSDLYAMGCEAHSAQAIVTLPYAAPRYLRSDLQQLMQGCNEALKENHCALIGGHSAEGSDLSLGLVVNGFSSNKALRKSAVELGDSLILCRPLGSGCLLAADMRGRARHPWITAMLDQMQTSNRQASAIFAEFAASACTDVTGFGLAGHLLEMLNERRARAEVTLDCVPAYEGALQMLAAGSRSTLAQANRHVEAQLYNTEAFANDQRIELLFDPQTAGGLLAAIKPERATDCVERLRSSGYPDAQIIGRIAALETDSAAIVLR